MWRRRQARGFSRKTSLRMWGGGHTLRRRLNSRAVRLDLCLKITETMPVQRLAKINLRDRERPELLGNRQRRTIVSVNR